MENLSAPEETKQEFEKLYANSPQLVFRGAILACGNRLITDYEQVVDLFAKMQDGEFAYPESLQSIIENVKIYRDGIKPHSGQIDWIFTGISRSKSVTWWSRSLPGRWSWYGGMYELTNEAAARFIKEWGGDEELMEFFGQCADFLNIGSNK